MQGEHPRESILMIAVTETLSQTAGSMVSKLGTPVLLGVPVLPGTLHFTYSSGSLMSDHPQRLCGSAKQTGQVLLG